MSIYSRLSPTFYPWLRYNVLNKTLSEYTFAEWYVCLDEKVLLEQCLPRYSEKLDMDPLMPGLFSKGEILYKITQIDKSFWTDHPDWYEYFRTIIHGVLDMGKEGWGVGVMVTPTKRGSNHSKECQ